MTRAYVNHLIVAAVYIDSSVSTVIGHYSYVSEIVIVCIIRVVSHYGTKINSITPIVKVTILYTMIAVCRSAGRIINSISV